MPTPIHAWLAGLADPRPGERVADLGCGHAPTMLQLALRCPDAAFMGLDLRQQPLLGARNDLRQAGVDAALVRADLSAPLPLAASSVDAAVCEDLIECLPDVGGFLEEVARVLRPGGRLILAHHDFDAMAFNATDRDLNRRVVHAYADAVPAFNPLGVGDGLIGRRMWGEVRRSPLVPIAVEAHTTIDTEFVEGSPGYRRAHGIADTLRHPSTRLRQPLPGDVIERWLAELRDTADAGMFFFCDVAYAVVALR